MERNTQSVYLITKTKDKRRKSEHIKMKNDGPKQDRSEETHGEITM